jgi:RNA polymerase sigma-70 factor, ECF subfamily
MNETLNDLRPRMMAVAYRMLGSVADAEDAVQDAFLRLQATEGVNSPEGFLVRTTTRRCLDRLRSRRRCERFVESGAPDTTNTTAARKSDAAIEPLSRAFLLMLERLTPSERATYLLRTVFNYKYAAIADVLSKAECHVRQIFRRANLRLLQNRRRFAGASAEAEALAERFVVACRLGDVRSIERLFVEEPTDDRRVARCRPSTVACKRRRVRERGRVLR